MYKSEVIDKDTVEKRIVTRLIVLWKKKRKKLFHDRIIIEEKKRIDGSLPYSKEKRPNQLRSRGFL
jgi:hypothetical protein